MDKEKPKGKKGKGKARGGGKKKGKGKEQEIRKNPFDVLPFELFVEVSRTLFVTFIFPISS